MDKNAEDQLAEKERDYNQGFLDASELLLHQAQTLKDSVSEDKLYGKTLAAMESVYTSAVEQHLEDVRMRFGLFDLNAPTEQKKAEENKDAKQ
jgi:hypothetical protein